MTELTKCLVWDSFAAPPAHILEGLDEALVHREVAGVPHTIYQELWHIVIWQQISLDWIRGIETPNLAQASLGFPTAEQTAAEPWAALCERFLRTMREAGEAADDAARLDVEVNCPSQGGAPTRVMTVRGQLESLAGHNAYHFGRIVLLRQMAGAWPPASGGFTW